MMRIYFIIFIASVLFVRDMYAQKNNSTDAEVIKIGLLINNNRLSEARNGAEMAIRKANERRGSNSVKFKLVVKSMEGQWGTGSKEVVNLVFEENVWAIMGSHDGRNAHLVEQVIAKTHIVFLSAWATDPTLSQAYVPWYFSCVPNNDQQAQAIVDEIYKKRNLIKIATVSNHTYDSKMALKSFLKNTKTSYDEPLQLFIDDDMKNFNILLDRINKEGIDGIVLFGHASSSWRFVEQLRQKKMEQPVFGTLSLLGENEFEDVDITQYDNVILVSSGDWLGSQELSFQNEYRNIYGKKPGVVASYAFDGMNVIIDGLRSSGLDREIFLESISSTDYNGVTGTIQFDEKGNRLGVVKLIEINNGIPINVEK